MTSKRLDCLVCGKDDNRLDNAVIIELKQWEKCALSDGDNLVSVWVGGAQRDILHPSAQSIRDLDIQAFNGIVETLRVVLPYVEDIQPEVTSELDRKVYLMMSEEKIGGKLPGWLTIHRNPQDSGPFICFAPPKTTHGNHYRGDRKRARSANHSFADR